MSDGIPFGGTAPAFPGGLDADQLAAVLRAIQASQPSAPTNDAPSAGVLSGIPSMLGGQMPAPQMAPSQDDAPTPGRLPTLLGSRLPEMTSVEPQPAPAVAPAPQATGSIPQAAPAPAGGEPNQPAPSTPPAAPAPTAPAAARPSAPAGIQPVSSFDPLTGQPVSGTPKPVAAPAPAAALTGGGLSGILGGLSNPRVYNTLLGIGAGILSGKTFGEGLGQGIENAQRMNAQQGATDLQQLKLQREQAALTGNAAILKRAYPNLSDAELAAMATNSGNVSTALQILRDPTHGMPKTPAQMEAEAAATARGSMEGSAKPFDRIKGEAQAQAEGSAAGSKDDVQIVTRPDNSIIGVNKSKIGEEGAVTSIAPGTPGARVWGTIGLDGRLIEPPPGTPPGTPGAYDEKGMPHVALTQGTNQLPQKANAELDQAAVKAITESRAKAEGAIGTIAAINRQKEAIDKGIVSGAGADWRTQARAVAAQVLGIPDSYVTQSQLFDQAATQKSAELAKAISQSGHTTNMDLQLGKTISSGDRSSVEAALRAGIEAQEILAKNTIAHHNASVDRFATPETAQRAGFFKVEQPEIYQYRPAAPDRSAVEAEMRRRGMMR